MLRNTVDPLPLTIVIPVKNEASNLPACLASLPPVAEVVVADSGSADASREIALQAGATLVDFKWDGQFPKKRNWILQNHEFQSPWVLFLDADEHLNPEFNASLPEALSRDDVSGYWLRYSNYFMGVRLNWGVPQRKLALFRVGSGAYEHIPETRWSALDMEVHEHPQLSGPIGELTPKITHNDFRGIHHFIAKHNEYSSWEANRLSHLLVDREKFSLLTKRQQRKYRYVSNWWFGPAYFLHCYILKLGFLDGKAGFTHATMKAIYFFETYLKVVELRRSQAMHERNGQIGRRSTS